MAATGLPVPDAMLASSAGIADAVMVVGVVGYVLLLAHDSLRPARRYAPVQGWCLAGVLSAGIMLLLNVAVPMVAAPILDRRALLPGAVLGDLGGFVVGLILTELAGYWVHRACHQCDFLWRWVHQMHHSAERFDAFGAFFFHPNEVLVEIGTSLVVCGAILGLTPDAAGLVGAASFLMGWFQHANVRTPRLIGLLVHRPESHAVHHARGLHTGNYGNLALWDQVFGTFSNPAEAPALAGFYDGSSTRIREMLLGKDISFGGLGRAGAPPLRTVRAR